MPLEDELQRIIKELQNLLWENNDINDEAWWRLVNEAKDRLEQSLIELA